ncbi:pro-sigmaK processing inhibitor BofA family protein [Caproiciproducens sp. MSJ-32]|uniref:pro-sigmaK processing inhibitor BofA family protein n=1 Tax=Caproiciproducens sp. MSJ-32 TaxID=2841527 RepID=UPI001C10C7F6|nr:pro-sigmaK processing inhibitor BofA family protein [Caproiciproducens sp. MSJ-32]MBU5455192.1 pro-sigmaK processing inhibitor BofA family protein [Caproiciproducens sp. MSJ-32]
MDNLVFGLIGLVLLIIVLKILKWPFKILINGIIGLVLLYLANILGSYLGFTIAINAVTALIAGFLGIPGIILLVVFQLFF